MSDILDIEGIFRFPWHKLFVNVSILVAIIVLILSIWWLVKWFKNRRKINPESLLSPSERFFLDITRLKKQNLLENGEFKKYIFFLSEIFRRYLSERFDYPALDKTTEELITDIREQKNMPSEISSISTATLNLMDQIKFAGFAASISQAEELTEAFLSFVRQNPEKKKEGA